MGLSFLSLPPEVRLQVYHWVYLNTPIPQRPLVPWLPAQKHKPYLVRPVMPDEVESAGSNWSAEGSNGKAPRYSSSSNKTKRQSSQRLLNPDRRMHKLPTPLLLTCKPVYFEARGTPFHENEFRCGEWFSTGTATGHAFFTHLTPWQRDATRFALLEVRDLDTLLGSGICADAAAHTEVGKNKNTTAVCKSHAYSESPVCHLIELCSLWGRGLRGLRLRITAPCRGSSIANASQRQAGEPTFRTTPSPDRMAAPEWRLLGGAGSGGGRPPAWIEFGLGQLQALRQLEVELVEATLMSKADKVAWCARLEELLNSQERRQQPVVVVPVEEQRDEPARNTASRINTNYASLIPS